MMTERIQKKNSINRQNYVVDMSLCQLCQMHGIIAEVNDVMMQLA